MIRIVFDAGQGVEYQFTMQPSADQMLAEFGQGKWTEIKMQEAAPAIRRNFPVSFTIKRVPD